MSIAVHKILGGLFPTKHLNGLSLQQKRERSQLRKTNGCNVVAGRKAPLYLAYSIQNVGIFARELQQLGHTICKIENRRKRKLDNTCVFAM